MKNKKLLILSVLFLCASCNNKNSSSVNSSDNNTSNSPTTENVQLMLNQINQEVGLESIVSLNQVMNVSGEKYSEADYYFALDVQTTLNEYAYQQYEEATSKEDVKKVNLNLSGDLINHDSYVCNHYLGIDNKEYFAKVSQETVFGNKNILWEDSGLSNFFSLLNSDMFTYDNGAYILKVNEINNDIKLKIAYGLYGENTSPKIAEFKLFAKDGQFTSYYAKTETQTRLDTTYQDVNYKLTYEYEGNIVYRNGDKEISKFFKTPLSGDEDSKFQSIMNQLAQGNYQEEIKTYQQIEANFMQDGTLLTSTRYLYGNNIIKIEELNSKDAILSTSGYYLDENNNLQEFIKVRDLGYYKQGEAYKTNAKKLYASFNMSSLLFTKEGNNVYYYDVSKSQANYFPLGVFNINSSGVTQNARIQIDNDEVEIAYLTAYSYSDTVYYVKTVHTFTNIGKVQMDVDASKITNGDNLTFDDYFHDVPSLETAKNILGETYNQLKPLGGNYNNVKIYANEEEQKVQFQYQLGSLSEFDFDGDNEVSSSEQAYLYAYIHQLLSQYDKKISEDYWGKKEYTYNSSFMQAIQAHIDSEENNITTRLSFQCFFTYDSDYNTYIVISVQKVKLIKVTFDLNYENSENIIKEVALGSSVTEPYVYRKGYAFDGWYLDKECTEKANVTTKVTENTTYYAKWVKLD